MRTGIQERKLAKTDLTKIIEEVKGDLKEELEQKHASLEYDDVCEVNIIPFQFRQLIYNLVSNSLKFANPGTAPHIKIKSEIGGSETFKNNKLLKGYELLFAENNPAGLKAILAELGIIKNVLRLPLVPLSQGIHKQVKDYLPTLK